MDVTVSQWVKQHGGEEVCGCYFNSGPSGDPKSTQCRRRQEHSLGELSHLLQVDLLPLLELSGEILGDQLLH